MIERDGKVYVTPQEAADALKIPRPTVYQWCRNSLVGLLSLEAAKALKASGESESQYLIEIDSLLDRHRSVHLGEA